MFQAQSAANDSGAAKPAASAGGLLANYAPADSAYDELLDKDGNLRPHYAQWLAGLDANELNRRAEMAKLLIQEQGITYHVYTDPRGTERPWQLDPIPFIVAPGRMAGD